MIEVRNAVIGYGTTRFITAVNGVDLTIEENEVLGIAGESGSGKSTLMRAIYGDFSNGLRIQSGTISGRFNDPRDGRVVETDSSGMRDHWWDLVSYVPQGSMSVLNPLMKVQTQLVDGLPSRERQGSRSELRKRLARFLEGLGLEEAVLDAYPHQLSGGMRQRVLVAIAAFVNPRLILADEPTTALDVTVQAQILDLIRTLQREFGTAVILITHDMGVVAEMADRVVVMHDKRIQQVGPPMEIYSRPANAWVARFVGSPAMNLAPVELAGGEGRFARVRLADGSELETRVLREGLSGPLQLGIRPESVRVVPLEPGAMPAEVELVERLGDRTLVYARLADGLAVTAEDAGISRVKTGDRIGLRMDASGAHLFAPDGSARHAEAA